MKLIHGSDGNTKISRTLYTGQIMIMNWQYKLYIHTNISYILVARVISSGEASPTFRHANVNFSVFMDRIRNQFLKK